MDGIEVYNAAPRLPGLHTTAPDLAQAKVTSDYVRAIIRKVWLVLMVAVPVSVAITIWTIRKPPVYQAMAQVTIIKPEYDPALSAIVPLEVGRSDTNATLTYLPNLVARLKSKALAERVINDPAFLQGTRAPDTDAVEEFVKCISTKTFVGTNLVNVYLEGTDPARTAEQLRLLIDTFSHDAEREAGFSNEDTLSNANENLASMERDLKALEEKNITLLKSSKTIGPGGKNVVQTQFENLNLSLIQKRSRLDDFQQQSFLARVSPRANVRFDDPTVAGQIADLQKHRTILQGRLEDAMRIARNTQHDPAVKSLAMKLERVLSQLDRLQTRPTDEASDPSEIIITSMREEIRTLEQAADTLLAQHHVSLAEHELYLQYQTEREMKLAQIYELRTKVQAFELLAKSQAQKPPVKLLGGISEPIDPIRPNRPLFIALGVFLGLGMGVGLVCMLEHLDHAVKVPEHLSIGLSLPLLGVVPRIRRTSLVHRGGHLWTQGAPESVEADAYRNLRASLLGASDRLGPIVTLLVTSAKASEGKSTTALNLAATCARAGERTLLMDVDLRRPSLGEVFQEEGATTGLVDVLRGALPWQRAVVSTEIPNLDFLPTGDSSDVPIEILGTIELRQLLLGLSQHYDRVILDGPAILGMADCRMLGRVVDAAMLVVRSGSHELRPLLRAKSMLEQSHIVIAGVVFNGLYEDFHNWSSYGPYTPYGADGLPARSNRQAVGLGAPTEEYAPLAMAGAIDD